MVNIRLEVHSWSEMFGHNPEEDNTFQIYKGIVSRGEMIWLIQASVFLFFKNLSDEYTFKGRT